MTTQNSKNSSMIKYLKVLKMYLYPDKIEYIFWVATSYIKLDIS